MPLAIVSALPEEQHGLQALLHDARTERHAGRDFTRGQLHGQDVVLALSGIGKVAAATTTAVLIERFAIQRLLFTGVAGGLAPQVRVGDVVVAQQFVQHDMDVRPIVPRWQVPGYAQPCFACDTALTGALQQAAQQCVQAAQGWQLALLGGHAPQVHSGLIASGDQFIVAASTSQRIHSELHEAGYPALAVEMEGAAIAQTCADYGLPFAAVRTISDRADDNAHVDFPAFVQSIASRYALEIVQALVRGGI
ncbi:MAG: 5'-methylthioadenosine/adenosylhomocysteine nucleosidase [Comamonas sp.]|nr:5'-methylthioadenosine/adenosylhomocysteine nucleosidase [Comamonas sp.]